MPSPRLLSPPSICSAGYLFGTTRTRQPALLGSVPLLRYEAISGGVLSSLPGENGSKTGGSPIESVSKSVGRFARSAAMITQRDDKGSLRNSEGITPGHTPVFARTSRFEGG